MDGEGYEKEEENHVPAHVDNGIQVARTVRTPFWQFVLEVLERNARHNVTFLLD